MHGRKKTTLEMRSRTPLCSDRTNLEQCSVEGLERNVATTNACKPQANGHEHQQADPEQRTRSTLTVLCEGCTESGGSLQMICQPAVQRIYR